VTAQALIQVPCSAAGLDIAPYSAKAMFTIDPFGNRLRFEQEIPK
jgi:hypothetical protein